MLAVMQNEMQLLAEAEVSSTAERASLPPPTPPAHLIGPPEALGPIPRAASFDASPDAARGQHHAVEDPTLSPPQQVASGLNR